MKLTDYQNVRNWQIEHKDKGAPKNLQPDQYVYISYFKDYSEGCQHYIRGCQVKCETCNKFYPCRICHDEIEDHEFPRYDLKIVKCNKCGKEQPFNDHCIYCNHLFATYKCDICKVLCSLGFNAKPNYHCPKCKVCMVELPQESIHCDRCNQCIKIEHYKTHDCIKPKSDVCPICYSSTQKSIFPVVTLPCGHQMHYHCFVQYEQQRNDVCPLCKKSLFKFEDLEQFYNQLDRLYDKYLVDQNLPQMYLKILCNQCSNIFQVQSHPLGLYRCQGCKFYNNTVIDYQDHPYENIQLYERKYRIAQNQDDVLYVLQKYFNNKENSLTGEQIIQQIGIDLQKDYWFPAFLNRLDKITFEQLQQRYDQIKDNPKKQQYVYLLQFPQFRDIINQVNIDEQVEGIEQNIGQIEEEYQEESSCSQKDDNYNNPDLDEPIYRI